jgi:hypothetical protein
VRADDPPRPDVGVGDLQSAEIAAEGELLRVVDLLVVEDEHGELVHAFDDRRDLLWCRRLAQIDAGNFAGKERAVGRVDWADGKRHRSIPVSTCDETIIRSCQSG